MTDRKENKTGILAVLSGFSGSGKGTVVKRLLEKYDNYALSISATTRKPRDGETEGKEYFFKSVDEFKSMIDGDGFIEYACYVDNYYGTPKQFVLDMLNDGKNVILEIEPQGAMQVKEKMPEAVTVFMTPPGADELEARLRARGTESEETIIKRLRRAYDESEYMSRYDYIIVNDNIDECVDEFHRIIMSEHFPSEINEDFINKIRDELGKFQNI